MADQPLNPFPAYGESFAQMGINIPTDAVLSWLVMLVLVFVALYALVIVYHLLKYGMAHITLEPGEQTVRKLRKHWFVYVTGLLPYAILAVLPLALPTAIKLAPPLAPYASLFAWNTASFVSLLGLYWLVVGVSALGAFTRYYLTLWVLTNQRIIDIKQRRFFNRLVSSLLINRVQDVTIDVEGVLESLLGFGDINVQSAGATERFRMRGIPHPEAMRDIILKYVGTREGGASGDGAL